MRKRMLNVAKALEDWFAVVKRPMPWRSRPEPYVCWLSEIMMQQTTYGTVLPYYERFLKKFPTVVDLANADEADVLKAWEGMGYYARARNLLKAARELANGGKPSDNRRGRRSLGVEWPKTSAGWAALPGVGPYTAAALSSVLNGERTPVVDGNVARVFSRVWKLTDDFSKQPNRAKLAARLQPAIDSCRVPGDFNQAMMELGALVCTPTSPNCAKCPLAKACAAREGGTQTEYPVKSGKRPLPVRKVSAVIVRDAKGRVLLVQNREGGLLKGLWELPAVEPSGGLTQVFSHFKLELSTVRVASAEAEFRDPKSIPLTTATRKALGLP